MDSQVADGVDLSKPTPAARDGLARRASVSNAPGLPVGADAFGGGDEVT